MHISILERRKMKAAALGLALTSPIAGFESVSKSAIINTSDVVVEQVGNGSAALGNGSAAVFLDIYTPTVAAGNVVTLTPESTPQIALPSASSVNGAASNPLTASGTASSEGEITISADGSTVLVPGYSANAGVTGIASSNSTTYPREVGLVSTATGAIDTSTTTTAFNGNNIRSAVLVNSTTLYAAGATSPGITAFTVDGNATTNGAGVQLQNTVTNLRQLQLFGGTLYASDSSGSAVHLGSVTGFNGTANSATYAELPGTSANNAASPTGTGIASPYGFAFADGGATLYVADQASNGNNGAGAGVIEKFSLTGGTYVLDGSVAIGNTVTGVSVESLTGPSGTFDAIFATTPGEIYEISDASGVGGSLNGATLNSLVAVGTNQAFRGIATEPGATVPEPTAASVLVLGTTGLLARRRRNLKRRGC
jgi:hypothetical protein